MIWKLILGLLFLSVLILCIRVLHRSKGTSLLAWQVLTYIVVFDSSAYFIESASGWKYNPLPFVQAVEDAIIFSLILVNLIAIAYLLFLARVLSSAYASHGVLVRSFSKTSVFYWIAIPVVLLGILIFVNSPLVRVVRQYGYQSLGDFSFYYSIRFESGLAGMSAPEWWSTFIVIRTVLPLITLYSLYRFILEENKSWLVRWLLLLILWSGVAILSFQKAPLVTVALSNCLAAIMLFYFKGVRWKTLQFWAFTGVAIVLLLVVIIYRVTEGRFGLQDIASKLTERFIFIPMVTTYRHYLVFPEWHPFTYYADSRTLNIFLAGGHPITTSLTAFQIASYYTVGIAFNMNTSFLGDTWAAMGYVGVVQGALIIFGAFLFWDIYLLRTKTTPILLAPLVAYFLGSIYNIINVPMMAMLLSSGMVFGPLFWLLLVHRELQMGLPNHLRSSASSWTKR